jgi:hypothetical protein
VLELGLDLGLHDLTEPRSGRFELGRERMSSITRWRADQAPPLVALLFELDPGRTTVHNDQVGAVPREQTV